MKEQEILQEIGLLIRTERIKAKINTKTLATKVNMSTPTLRSIEQGKNFSLKSMLKISEALGINPTLILFQALINVDFKNVEDINTMTQMINILSLRMIDIMEKELSD